MDTLKTVEEKMEECTHNCMTCGMGCEDGAAVPSDRMTLEQTLYRVSDVESDALLKALEDF
jgi:hypothetical protein